MTLARGSRLGRYEIVSPIGAGGMGEVYRATDASLKRDVALKILPASLVAEPSRMVRFEQEARATAALHHPNIVTIHDFDASESQPYLVTELLEGETLADVLTRGPVSLRRALQWGVQILRGIAAAHARGIIHRDLKPANIFVVSDGTVKVLDFGLAKVRSDAAEVDAPTARLSATGAVLGTVGYMAPEQIRGTEADARTDIFSFGVVMYEMLTGESPFLRATSAETLSAILRDDPPRLPAPQFPSTLAATLQRCLEKSADERFHSAHDLALHLEMIDVAASGSTSVVTINEGAAPAHIQQVTFRRGNILNARFAPDGSVLYGAAWNDEPLHLYISHRGMPEARALGINASIHSISRNGEMAVSLGRKAEFGFQYLGTLARVGLAGGTPRVIANDVYEADWAPDGKQLAICRRSAGGFQIEYPVGRPIHTSASWISDMRFSPDGTQIAFIEHPNGGDNFGHVKVVELNGTAEQLTDDMYVCWGLAWNPVSGEVWYSAAPSHTEDATNISVWGVGRNKKTRGVFSSLGATFLRDIAPDGTLLLESVTLRRHIVGNAAGQDGDRDLSWFDWSFPMRLSPDGGTLLFEEQGMASRGKYTMYLRSTDGSPAVRLEEGQGRDISADGEYVLALTNDPPHQILLIPTGAGEMREIIVRGIDYLQSARFLPNGTDLMIVGSREGEGARLWRVPVAGGDAIPLSEPIIGSWFFIAIAPDGGRVAIMANQKARIFSLEQQEPPQDIPGLERDEVPVHWRGADELLVCKRYDLESQIFSVDLVKGTRRHERTLRPSDPAGVQGVFPVLFASTGDTCVFGYRLLLSSLFIAKGVQ